MTPKQLREVGVKRIAKMRETQRSARAAQATLNKLACMRRWLQRALCLLAFGFALLIVSKLIIEVNNRQYESGFIEGQKRLLINQMTVAEVLYQSNPRSTVLGVCYIDAIIQLVGRYPEAAKGHVGQNIFQLALDHHLDDYVKLGGEGVVKNASSSGTTFQANRDGSVGNRVIFHPALQVAVKVGQPESEAVRLIVEQVGKKVGVVIK